ncbi:MAG: hypothetical protein COA79_21135 [Planctomycetota bacterium]|nr:MAG: hypothetical protein COA79_21135 [Planctomycetota bacterium]
MLHTVKHFQTKKDQAPKRLLSLGLSRQQIIMLTVGYHDGSIDKMPELINCLTFPIENEANEIIGVVGLTENLKTITHGDLSTGIFNRLALNVYSKVIISSFLDTLDLMASGVPNAITLFSDDISTLKNIDEVTLLRYYDRALPIALEKAGITVRRKI